MSSIIKKSPKSRFAGKSEAEFIGQLMDRQNQALKALEELNCKIEGTLIQWSGGSQQSEPLDSMTPAISH